jgi:NifU-like protein
VGIYPSKIAKIAAAPVNAGAADGENARGRDASFVCGSFAGFSITVDADEKAVTSAAFQTNGCGYMIAAADVLCDAITGRHLSDLHGLDEVELTTLVTNAIGPVPDGRRHCLDTCISALRQAFADHRARQIEEFRGEKALVCTCFGVSEETIEHHIRSLTLESVDDVTNACRAGGGCGSCRMLIQEMLDLREREAVRDV